MEPFAGYGGIAGTILGTKDFDISSIYVWCREGGEPPRGCGDDGDEGRTDGVTDVHFEEECEHGDDDDFDF